MEFNITFNNISITFLYIVAKKTAVPAQTTELPQVTDVKLYHIMLTNTHIFYTIIFLSEYLNFFYQTNKQNKIIDKSKSGLKDNEMKKKNTTQSEHFRN
jgi:hypothetical protein